MDDSLASNKICSDTKYHVYVYYGYWVTLVQEEEEEEENMDKVWKLFLVII